MKWLFRLAILSPVVAYLLVLISMNLTVGVLVVLRFLFVALMVTSVVSAIAYVFKARIQRLARYIVVGVTLLFSGVILMGLIDLTLLFTGMRPIFLYSNGEGFADLGAIILWFIVVMPLAYGTTAITLVITHFLQKRTARRAPKKSVA